MYSPLFYAKSVLVGTGLEAFAKKLRWALGIRQRIKHPELWELYLEERRLPLILQRVLSADSCGVDVGCHIGSFLSLLMKCAPRGRHVAFEASPTKSKALQAHFPSAKIYALAVSDKDGVATFQENFSDPGFSRLGATTSSGGTASYTVKTCRLDDILLGSDRIDLIKLDIEGAELAALRGGVQLTKKFHPMIIFECGGEYGPAEEKVDRRALYDFITRDLNYDIFTFEDFLFDKGPISFEEFRKCGLYPFRAFNFFAAPRQIS
jgi:FkbM family methyltransferase